MHNYNLLNTEAFAMEHHWNNLVENAEYASNITADHHDYYESKLVFETAPTYSDHRSFGSNCVISDTVQDVVLFLDSDTSLLASSAPEPLSIRIIWNKKENISRVYLPNPAASSDQDTACLSVQGDPYHVEQHGVMLDETSYVRVLLSEYGQIPPEA